MKIMITIIYIYKSECMFVCMCNLRMFLLLGSGGVFFWVRSEAVNNNKNNT
jgi:hypothetical protein